MCRWATASSWDTSAGYSKSWAASSCSSGSAGAAEGRTEERCGLTSSDATTTSPSPRREPIFKCRLWTGPGATPAASRTQGTLWMMMSPSPEPRAPLDPSTPPSPPDRMMLTYEKHICHIWRRTSTHRKRKTTGGRTCLLEN